MAGHGLWQLDVASALDEWAGRERALIESAMNFHALDSPGAELALHVHIADRSHHPVLTDVRTLTGEYIDRFPARGAVRFRSVARGESRSRTDPQTGDALALGVDRWVLITSRTADRVVVGRERRRVTPRGLAASAYWRARSVTDAHAPLAIDAARQMLLTRRARSLHEDRVPRVPGFAHLPPLVEPVVDRPRALLFGVHWFELGGAERWAFESIRLAREAGFTPIVISDKSAQHDYLDAPELDGAVRIPLTHPMDQRNDRQPLLAALLANFDVAGVFIHHCHWMYDRTPWFKAVAPDLPIVDSLHILEYSGGGYAAIAARFTDFIDVHHVISPQLERWLIDVQEVEASRVVLAPLIGLSEGEATPRSFQRREASAPFRLGYVARYALQKRPHLFLQLIRNLLRSGGVPVEGVMQGEGELEPLVKRMIRRLDLRRAVELVPARTPVTRTFAKMDCLVLSSQNEGITLTTIEAVAAGVPVLSTDVGSQNTLVPPELLVPRSVRPFLAEARSIVNRLARDEVLRERLWNEQRRMVEEFSRHRGAKAWAASLFDDWMERPTVFTDTALRQANRSAEAGRTAAVVVAYNRVEKLKTVIASIEAQDSPPDWLVVVDNASTDGTGEYLKALRTDFELVVVSNVTNEGGAGGFADGMTRAYELGADFVWIMDDDCYPTAGALGELERGFDRAVGKLGGDVPFACSLVRYTDGEICEMNNAEPTWDWPRLISGGDSSVTVTTCSFVSVLFPRWVLEQHGLPFREYFIWFDDAEYTKRVTRVCPGVQVLTSGVVHDMGDNKGVNFGLINESNAWKFAHGVRNQASYRLHHESLPAFLLFAARLVFGMRRGGVSKRLQVRMLRQLLKGVRFDPPVRHPHAVIAERSEGVKAEFRGR